MDKNKRSESLAHGLYVSYGGFGHSGTLFMGGFFFLFQYICKPLHRTVMYPNKHSASPNLI